MMRHHIIIIGTNTMTRLCLIRSIGEVIDCDITGIHMVYEMPKKKYLPSDAYSKYVKECFFAYKFNAESLCSILLEHCSGTEEKPLILLAFFFIVHFYVPLFLTSEWYECS